MFFNLLDLCIVVAAVMAARFLPKVVDRFHFETPSSRLLLAAGVLVVGAFIGQAIGLVAGSHIHAVIPMGPARMADRVVGSAVGALGLAVAVWLLLPSIAEVPGSIARQARGSEIARFIDRT